MFTIVHSFSLALLNKYRFMIQEYSEESQQIFIKACINIFSCQFQCKRFIAHIDMVGNTSDNYLMTRLDKVHDTLIANLLHISFLLPSICLLHSNERLCERHGSEPTVKEEEAFIWVDPQEGGNDEGGGQAQESPFVGSPPGAEFW